MPNSTITEGITVLLYEQSVPLWIRTLALLGALSVANTAPRYFGQLISLGVYVIAMFIWFKGGISKWRNK